MPPKPRRPGASTASTSTVPTATQIGQKEVLRQTRAKEYYAKSPPPEKAQSDDECIVGHPRGRKLRPRGKTRSDTSAMESDEAANLTKAMLARHKSRTESPKERKTRKKKRPNSATTNSASERESESGHSERSVPKYSFVDTSSMMRMRVEEKWREQREKTSSLDLSSALGLEEDNSSENLNATVVEKPRTDAPSVIPQTASLLRERTESTPTRPRTSTPNTREEGEVEQGVRRNLTSYFRPDTEEQGRPVRVPLVADLELPGKEATLSAFQMGTVDFLTPLGHDVIFVQLPLYLEPKYGTSDLYIDWVDGTMYAVREKSRGKLRHSWIDLQPLDMKCHFTTVQVNDPAKALRDYASLRYVAEYNLTEPPVWDWPYPLSEDPPSEYEFTPHPVKTGHYGNPLQIATLSERWEKDFGKEILVDEYTGDLIIPSVLGQKGRLHLEYRFGNLPKNAPQSEPRAPALNSKRWKLPNVKNWYLPGGTQLKDLALYDPGHASYRGNSLRQFVVPDSEFAEIQHRNIMIDVLTGELIVGQVQPEGPPMLRPLGIKATLWPRMVPSPVKMGKPVDVPDEKELRQLENKKKRLQEEIQHLEKSLRENPANPEELKQKQEKANAQVEKIEKIQEQVDTARSVTSRTERAGSKEKMAKANSQPEEKKGKTKSSSKAPSVRSQTKPKAPAAKPQTLTPQERQKAKENLMEERIKKQQRMAIPPSNVDQIPFWATEMGEGPDEQLIRKLQEGHQEFCSVYGELDDERTPTQVPYHLVRVRRIVDPDNPEQQIVQLDKKGDVKVYPLEVPLDDPVYVYVNEDGNVLYDTEQNLVEIGCVACSSPTHLVMHCPFVEAARQLGYNVTANGEIQPCAHCNDRGHTDQNCAWIDRCYLCKSEEHRWKECPQVTPSPPLPEQKDEPCETCHPQGIFEADAYCTHLPPPYQQLPYGRTHQGLPCENCSNADCICHVQERVQSYCQFCSAPMDAEMEHFSRCRLVQQDACMHCFGVDHYTYQCNYRWKGQIPCYLCKSRNHSPRHCPLLKEKLKWVGQVPRQCTVCQAMYHSANMCSHNRRVRVAIPPFYYCGICGELGHNDLACKQGVTNGGKGRRGDGRERCAMCGAYTHDTQNCPYTTADSIRDEDTEADTNDDTENTELGTISTARIEHYAQTMRQDPPVDNPRTKTGKPLRVSETLEEAIARIEKIQEAQGKIPDPSMNNMPNLKKNLRAGEGFQNAPVPRVRPNSYTAPTRNVFAKNVSIKNAEKTPSTYLAPNRARFEEPRESKHDSERGDPFKPNGARPMHQKPINQKENPVESESDFETQQSYKRTSRKSSTSASHALKETMNVLNRSVEKTIQNQERMMKPLIQGQIEIAKGMHNWADQEKDFRKISTVGVCDGADKSKFDQWLHDVEIVMTNVTMSPLEVLKDRSTGMLLEHVQGINPNSRWEDIKAGLKRSFSARPGPIGAAAYYDKLYQDTKESMSVFIRRYTDAFEDATGMTPDRCRDPTHVTAFVKKVRNAKVASRIAGKEPTTLASAFAWAQTFDERELNKEALQMQRAGIDEFAAIAEKDHSRTNDCYRCGELGHFGKECPYDEAGAKRRKQQLKAAAAGRNPRTPARKGHPGRVEVNTKFNTDLPEGVVVELLKTVSKHQEKTEKENKKREENFAKRLKALEEIKKRSVTPPKGKREGTPPPPSKPLKGYEKATKKVTFKKQPQKKTVEKKKEGPQKKGSGKDSKEKKDQVQEVDETRAEEEEHSGSEEEVEEEIELEEGEEIEGNEDESWTDSTTDVDEE